MTDCTLCRVSDYPCPDCLARFTATLEQKERDWPGKFPGLAARIPEDEAPRRARVLIIGHGRHGKDTAAEMFANATGYSFASSSEFCAQRAVFHLVSDLYPDWQAAYADRANHRELWYHAIRAYNLRPGPMLAEQILAQSDLYVGMRSRAEFERSRDLFDLVIWVDRSEVLPPEPGNSMELTAEDADWFLDNNRDLEHLEAQVLEYVLG